MKERIMEILKANCALPENISEKSQFLMLSIDSLSFINFLVEVENEFGIEFKIEEWLITHWETVGEFIRSAEEMYAEK